MIPSQFTRPPGALIRPARARPRMPCGRTSRTTIRTPSAPTFLSSMGIHSVDTEMNMPTTRLPTRAPNAVPSPPRVTAAKMSSRIWKPIWKFTPWARPSRMPASPARAAPGDPDHPDDPVDVDAGGSRQRRVVGHRAGRLADPGAQQRARRRQQHDDGDRHADVVLGVQRDGTDVEPDLTAVGRVGLVAAAEEVQEDVAHQDREPDRHDHRGDQPGAAPPQRRPQAGVIGPADRRRRASRAMPAAAKNGSSGPWGMNRGRFPLLSQ